MIARTQAATLKTDHKADILLVDDSTVCTALFVNMLGAHGFNHQVAVVHDGLAGLNWLFGTGEYAGRDTNTMPRVILLDLDMPRMGGLEALRRIRAESRTRLLPVVVFSASADPENVAEAYRLGANSYVNKAFTQVPFPELVQVIARYWLDLNEQPPQAR